MEKSILPQSNNSLICIVRQPSGSKGIFLGEHPLHYSTPVLMAQLSISAILTATFQYFLLPLGETTFTCQTLTGLLLGPSGLGKIKNLWLMLFPRVSFYIGNTISFFGLTFFLFLVGVKMDITIAAKSGRKATAIGLCNFFVPLILNECLAIFLIESIPMDPILHGSICWVATFQSISSFYVINGVLTDLKLLNSEMGRLATSSSMISDLCTWAWCAIIFTSRQNYTTGKPNMTLEVMILAVGMIFTISYVLRPIMIWMARKTGEEKAVSESYISAVLIMLLCCSMMGEIIGQHFMFGPMVSMIILPFHRSLNELHDDTTEKNANSIQEVNRRIIELAPCSVAILVYRGRLGEGISSTFNLAVVFLGGKDDREALAYGIRMAKHPKARLSVVNLIDSGKDGKCVAPDADRDGTVMDRFKANEKDRCRYKEEFVADSVEVISAMRTVEKDFDLIMVGRVQNCDPRLLIGLAQWNEVPELGYLGDMLSSVDSSCRASVLVVQQQSPVKGILNEDMDSPKSCAVVDMPFVWSNTCKS